MRRVRTRELGERTWLLEKERETAARLAVEGERARVARELHDIVSHSVSVMVVQAGAARHAVEEGETADALAAVEKTGRDAMTELRHLLGVLAPDQEGADALAPQPGLSRLGTLVDRIAFAGLPVEVTINGEPTPLPTGIDVTAYRVVQEALTNALKHAPGSRAEVRVGYGTRNLRIEVLNTGSNAPVNAGDGRGLIGLRERVALYGGDLDARRRFGGGYRVRARIPLERP
ncbi:sensor histidine kinase [Actinomadura alba]|uniref:histidine kinase n=2 Tax=Actinomadura alba TaxID=406431 RepID=A0ABR7LNQ3_9ACTN|nr:sensor histidine kinase [Actinomadura alba]